MQSPFCAIAKPCPTRSSARAAPQAGPVADVVEQKSRGVDELDRGGELLVARAAVAEQRSATEGQHRPHAFAAACDQMPGKLRDQGDLALHAVENHRVHAMHVVRDERHQRIEGRCGGGVEIVNGGGHGAALAGEVGFS